MSVPNIQYKMLIRSHSQYSLNQSPWHLTVDQAVPHDLCGCVIRRFLECWFHNLKIIGESSCGTTSTADDGLGRSNSDRHRIALGAIKESYKAALAVDEAFGKTEQRDLADRERVVYSRRVSRWILLYDKYA